MGCHSRSALFLLSESQARLDPEFIGPWGKFGDLGQPLVFDAPYQLGGQYRAAGPGFYQRNNENSSYPDRRPSLEESLTKFMTESAKRLKENSNIINEIRASTDATIRNQGASNKTLEIQIGQMSKVLQERGFGSLPNSTKTNPQD
ncbi:hypothetical protein Tco_0712152 [Tanacetum coccineum]